MQLRSLHDRVPDQRRPYLYAGHVDLLRYHGLFVKGHQDLCAETKSRTSTSHTALQYRDLVVQGHQGPGIQTASLHNIDSIRGTLVHIQTIVTGVKRFDAWPQAYGRKHKPCQGLPCSHSAQ